MSDKTRKALAYLGVFVLMALSAIGGFLYALWMMAGAAMGPVG